jgi:TP901 family phage tail tape measure protein
MRQAAAGMERFASGARGIIAGPIQSYEDFGHTIARAGGLAKVSGEQLKVLHDEALRLGSTVGEFSAKQAAEGMAEFGIAGYNVAEIMGALPTTLDLSSAAGMGLSDTVGVMTGIMGAFNLDAIRATDVADVLTATFTGSKTTLQSLGETISYSGANFAELGVDIKTAAAMIGLLGNASIEGTRAGTAMNSVLARLTAPRRMGLKVMESIGLGRKDIEDSTGKLREPMKILAMIAERTEKMTAVERKGFLTRLFGMEAGPAVAVLMAKNGSEKMLELADAIEKSKGRTTELANTMRGTGRGATQQLTSAIDTFKIVVGETTDSVLRPLKLMLADIIGRITGWAKEHPNLTTAIMITVGAVATLASVGTGLIYTMVGITSAMAISQYGIGGLRIGLQLLRAGLETTALRVEALTAKTMILDSEVLPARKGIVALAGTIVRSAIPATIAWAGALWPVLVVIAAVAATVAVVYLALKYWDRLVAIWERFKNASIQAKIAISALLIPFQLILAPITAVITAVKVLTADWEGLKTALAAPFVYAIGKIKSVIEWIEKIELPSWIREFGLFHERVAGTVAGGVAGAAGAVAGGVAGLGREIGYVAAGGATGATDLKTSEFLERTEVTSNLNNNVNLKIEFDDRGRPFVRGAEADRGVDLEAVYNGYALGGA